MATSNNIKPGETPEQWQSRMGTPGGAQGAMTPTPNWRSGGNDYNNGSYTGPLPPGATEDMRVNTAQPNPATISINPPNASLTPPPVPGLQPGQVQGTLPGETALTTFQSADIAGQYGATNAATGQVYQKALAQAQSSGPPPQDGGAARTGVQTALAANPPPPDTSGVDAQLAEDKGYQQLLADKTEYNSVGNQSKSLLDYYNQAITTAGIPKINEKLLDYDRIINGTEDSIRQEIQASGGLGTESQILALSLGRNKQLVQNYNNLLASKNMAMESINNMVSLASQDRQFAQQNILQKFQMDQQINEYRDKFINNAKEGYTAIINTMGYQGLLQSLDPSEIPLVERSLNLQPGQLQQLASYTQSQQNLKAIQASGSTSPYVNVNGEIQNTKTGEGYSSMQDFQAKTGLTLDEAYKKGLVQPLGESLDKQSSKLDLELKKGKVAQIPLENALLKAQIGATGRSNTGGSGGSSAGVLGLNNQQIDNVSPLVSSFQNSPIVQKYNVIGEAYSFVKGLSNTTTNPSDDQALVYAFAKAQDPDSVVREGEYATVQKYSQSLVDAYGKSVTQAINGTGFLSTEARKNMKTTIASRFKAVETSYNNLYGETSRRINLIGNTDKGNQLLNNYGGAFAKPSTSVMGPEAPANEPGITTNEVNGFWGKVTNWLWGE